MTFQGRMPEQQQSREFEAREFEGIRREFEGQALQGNACPSAAHLFCPAAVVRRPFALVPVLPTPGFCVTGLDVEGMERNVDPGQR